MSLVLLYIMLASSNFCISFKDHLLYYGCQVVLERATSELLWYHTSYIIDLRNLPSPHEIETS